MTPFDRFWYFIRERHSIFLKKEAGEPKPWTKDKILQQYRFCNVYRENDKVTRWIAENWRTPHAREPDLWFAMAVARYVNWPDSLQDIGYLLPWRPDRFKKVLRARAILRQKVFTGAYIIHSRGKLSKGDYIADKVLTPLWKDRAKIRPRKGDTLAAFYTRLRRYNGMGSFMAAQVVADIKHVSPLKSASDYFTFSTEGPGSRRGLNVLHNLPEEHVWGKYWEPKLKVLQEKITPLVTQAKMPVIDAQDLQNCLCEFFKYHRGYSRSKYPGA